MPASSAQDASGPCASPAASPASSPVATPGLGILTELGEEIVGPASPASSPAATPCPTEPASGLSLDDQLATAASVVQTATASAPTPEPTPTLTLDDQLATAAAVVQTATASAPTPVPTETPVPEPTATAAPQAGEVAEALPPVDLPVTNPQGYSFNLEASLTAEFGSVAPDAPVYRLTPIVMTREQVQALADALGIGGVADDRGNGNFTVSGNGQLFVTPTLIQYLSPTQQGEGDLPDDARAIEIARDWLRSSGFVQPDLGEGRVVSRVEDAGRLVVVFTPVEPQALLAGYPSINVSIGRGGTVLEVASRWATIQRADLYALRPAEDAWRQVEAGQAYIEADLAGSGYPDGSVISGLVTYDRIELAYTTAGPPGGVQYLAPVYMFVGSLTPEGRAEAYSVRAFVPALAISDSPVGVLPPGGLAVVESAA
jgi:hypothetical protein